LGFEGKMRFGLRRGNLESRSLKNKIRLRISPSYPIHLIKQRFDYRFPFHTLNVPLKISFDHEYSLHTLNTPFKKFRFRIFPS
jgi:hypothetical protein